MGAAMSEANRAAFADERQAEIARLVEERGRAEAGRLDRFIEGLGTIAAIAPPTAVSASFESWLAGAT